MSCKKCGKVQQRNQRLEIENRRLMRAVATLRKAFGEFKGIIELNDFGVRIIQASKDFGNILESCESGGAVKLYHVRNGASGSHDAFCLVLAETEDSAIFLAEEKLKAENPDCLWYYKDLEVTLIFDDCFQSVASDVREAYE